MLKTAPLSLSAEDAASTAAYLKGLSERSSNLTVVAQALFARCCLSTLACSRANMQELDREAMELGKRILSHPQPDQLGMDPVLVIEIYGMLKDAGCEAEAMRSVVERMAPELLGHPEEVQRIGRVRLIAGKLAELGFPIRQAKPAKGMAVTLKSPEKWFSAPAAEMADIADHLLADQRPLSVLTSRILSLIALAELRNYRIDLGCVLLRAVLQLGAPCQESEDAMHFIALQRRRDGRYGFPNQFVDMPEAGDDQHLKIYLPLTVNAVWLHAVAELSSQRSQIAVGA